MSREALTEGLVPLFTKTPATLPGPVSIVPPPLIRLKPPQLHLPERRFLPLLFVVPADRGVKSIRRGLATGRYP